MSNAPTFVSQAGNFSSAVSGQVDPRTGMYGANISLGKIIGNQGAGPIWPVSLNYSPMASAQGDQFTDLGLGSGVSLNITMYDSTNNMLVLSTGERYLVDEANATTDTDGGLLIPLVQSSLRTIQFKRYDNGSITWQLFPNTLKQYYKVIHKSGEIEILQGKNMGGSLKLPLLMINAAGLALTFNWQSTNLAGVLDDTGTTLLTTSFNMATFTFFPKTPESYVANLNYKTAGQLSSVDIKKSNDFGQDAWLTWTLTYGNYQGSNAWPGWLTGLTSPGGATESVQYAPTHTFPTSATISSTPMPAVQSYTRNPGGGQPAIRTTYTYTSQQQQGDMAGHNFVGGGNTGISNWVNNRDSLYDYNQAYAYSSTETCSSTEAGDKRTRVITRVYNKFHLLTAETVTQSNSDSSVKDKGKTVVTATSYYAGDAQTFDQQQHAFFQLPLKKTVTWVDGVDPVNDPHYTETTTYGQSLTRGPYGWDDFGNPLQKTEPDGLFTQWSYYDGTKSTSQCPADPNGFTRFVAWKRTDPSGVTGTFIVPGAPIQQTNYTYATATPAAITSKSPYVNSLVLKNYASHTSGGTLSGNDLVNGMMLSDTTYSYDTGGGLNAGRLTKQVLTHYPNGKTSQTSESYQSTETLTYTTGTFTYPGSQAINVLTTTHKLVANDPDVQADATNGHPAGYLQVQNTHSVSIYSGRVQQDVDTLGNVTQYEYDILGRMTERTLNATSSDGYTNVFKYAYAIQGTLLGDKNTYPFQVTKTDPNNNAVCYTLDGLRRMIRRDVNAVDVTNGEASWWKMEERGYNDMGRLASHSVFDYDVDASGHTTQTYTLATNLITYDDWGNTYQVAYNDGTADITVHDPVNKTVSSTRSGVTVNAQAIPPVTPTLGTGWSVSTYDYNATGRTIAIERRYSAATPDAAQAYSSRSRQYNGLSWAMSDTDELGRMVTYQYDPWGRVTDTTLPDKTNIVPATVVHRGYSPKSPAAWVNSIQVTGWLTGQGTPFKGTCTAGKRKFNSLGRVTSKTVGTYTWTYHYPYDSKVCDGYSQPDTAKAPDGYVRQYDYVYELGEVVRTASVQDHVHHFDYEPVTGIIKTAKADATEEGVTNTSQLTYTPFPSGRLRAEKIDYPIPSSQAGDMKAPLEKSTTYTYTVGGAMSTYLHVDGATSTVSRDGQGRINNVSDGAVSVTPQYDAAGRLTGWSATDGGRNRTLTTTLQLDDFGREMKRIISDGTDTWTITQDKTMWQKNDLVTNRHFQRNSDSPRYEIYSYDARNRLTVWDGENDSKNLPSYCDRFGNVLRKQSFTFDALNNITAVTTKFKKMASGSTNFSNTTTFKFDYSTDPCCLLGGSNTNTDAGPANFTVEYDKAGRITKDGQGTTLTYDTLGRVATAQSDLTGLSGTYGYDPLSRQGVVTSSDAANSPTYFYYRSSELVNLIQGDNNNVRLQRSLSGTPVAQYNSGGDQAGAWLLGTDRLGSVINASNGNAQDLEQRAYSAYGDEPVKKGS